MMTTTPPSSQQAERAHWKAVWGELPRATAGLNEARAWTIATAWREQLLGKDLWHKRLRLKTDALLSDELSLVESYEWVKIKVNSDSEAAVACAAATVWFWLSCCPGYSGVENPVFWKRVFSDLQLHRTRRVIKNRTPPRTSPSITDAVGFFDKPGREFPRIRLKVPYFSNCDAFLGLRQWPADSLRDEKFDDIYAYLQPFMDEVRLQRRIPVAIESKNWDGDSGTRTPSVGLMEPQLSTPEFPRFEVVSRLLHGWELRPNPLENAWLSDPRLVVKTVKCKELWKDWETCLTDTASTTIRSLLGPIPHQEHARIKVLELHRASRPSTLVELVFSALPHTTQVSTLRLLTPLWAFDMPSGVYRVSPFRAFTAMDWAWFGYAIFHPDAYTSTWRVLDIGVEDFTHEAAEVLRLMATGNNFSAVEKQSPTATNHFYHTARLREKSTVRLAASASSQALLDVDEGSAVCLVVDNDDIDLTRLEDWTRVVIRGLGFGWILSATITAVESRAPGKPCLRGLRLYTGVKGTVTDSALELVTLLGSSLSRLHGEAWKLVDSGTLTLLSETCPALETLSVCASAISLADFDPFPHLEELRVCARDDDALALLPTSTALTKLRTLHIATVRIYNQDHFGLLRTLLETHPQLQNFTWDEFDNITFTNEYSQHRNRTRMVLGGSARATNYDGPLHGSARVALLSVICGRRDDGRAIALARVDSHNLKQIVNFATSLHPRRVWIT